MKDCGWNWTMNNINIEFALVHGVKEYIENGFKLYQGLCRGRVCLALKKDSMIFIYGPATKTWKNIDSFSDKINLH